MLCATFQRLLQIVDSTEDAENLECQINEINAFKFVAETAGTNFIQRDQNPLRSFIIGYRHVIVL